MVVVVAVPAPAPAAAFSPAIGLVWLLFQSSIDGHSGIAHTNGHVRTCWASSLLADRMKRWPRLHRHRAPINMWLGLLEELLAATDCAAGAGLCAAASLAHIARDHRCDLAEKAVELASTTATTWPPRPLSQTTTYVYRDSAAQTI